MTDCFHGLSWHHEPMDIYMTIPGGRTEVLEHVETDVTLEAPVTVVVWDDPVNLMQYVTMVFKKVFPAWSLAECERRMLEVHLDARSAVFHGARDDAELIAGKLQSFQLWATVER